MSVAKDLNMDIEMVSEFIRNGHQDDKIYIGCDSSTKKTKAGFWVADYITVVVIHRQGRNGCKIFGRLETERDYTSDKRKPVMRLLNEAMKSTILYDQLKDAIGTRYREIHLDINPNEKFNSHLALSQAVGYIRGCTGIDAIVKPDAFAAQYAADRFMRVKNYDITAPDTTNVPRDYKRKKTKKVKRAA